MKNLILIGAGDFGVEVFSWLKDAKDYNTEWKFKAFMDKDLNALTNISFCKNYTVLDEEKYTIEKDDVFVCTIANPEIREKVALRMKSKNAQFISLIHNSVIFMNDVTVGNGVILSPYCIASNSARIEDFVTVNFFTSIGHHVSLGAFSQINCNCDITGHVKIGKKANIGSSVCIIPKVVIGDNVKIGAGSVVLKNIPNETVVFGNPAKIIM